uniref:Btz domain-containing protein n=2 Tax=Arion vulgaris TaxID=1028688 RepID=A0A0B7A4H3_9EUPU
MQFRHVKEEVQDRRERKRDKKNKQLQKEKQETTLERAKSRKAGNIPSNQVINGTVFGRHRENYSGHKRELERGQSSPDDIWVDFSKHQVNDNEWWGKNEMPAKKRRKNNTGASSSNIMGNEWRRQEFSDDVNTSFQHSNDRGDWRKNQEQRVHGKREHSIFTPEFNWKPEMYHGFNSKMPRGKRQDEDLMQRSYDSNQFKHPQLRHAASWPAVRKSGPHFAPNKNGFSARNDRFVAMKINCDITVNIRK